MHQFDEGKTSDFFFTFAKEAVQDNLLLIQRFPFPARLMWVMFDNIRSSTRLFLKQEKVGKT